VGAVTQLWCVRQPSYLHKSKQVAVNFVYTWQMPQSAGKQWLFCGVGVTCWVTRSLHGH
jgi:hypothetical protein